MIVFCHATGLRKLPGRHNLKESRGCHQAVEARGEGRGEGKCRSGLNPPNLIITIVNCCIQSGIVSDIIPGESTAADEPNRCELYGLDAVADDWHVCRLLRNLHN